MRLTTFTAPDMQTAIEHIRDSMGEDAIILSSKAVAGGGVDVTVAIEAQDYDNSDKAINGNASEYTNTANDNSVLLDEIEAILEFHSLPRELVENLLELASNINFEQDITQDGVARAIAKLLESAFDFSPLAIDTPGFSMMLIGSPGIGKTMAIAKLAAQLAVEKKPLCVISTDNSRAGGIEQLSAFTGILGLELKVADNPAGLRRCLRECDSSQHILIDSAGSNPYDGEQLSELKTLLQAADNVEPVLVIPAGLDSAEACHIAETFSGLGARRLLISRTDTARRYGSLLAAAAHADLTFCNISYSPKVVEGIPALDAGQMSYMLTRYLL